MINISTNTINFTWYSLLRLIQNHAYKVNIDRGSYAKEDVRYQFPSVAIEIKAPQNDMIPLLPATFKNAPTTQEYVDTYFAEKLMSTEVSENETYTYGERIVPQLDHIIERIRQTPFNNQMVIDVSLPGDIFLDDPPCLRLIDFKVTPHDMKLHMHVYFRSWELWAGLPTNLAGLELLKEFVVEQTGNVINGRLYAYSSGLHIYGANIENVKNLLLK